MRVRHPLEATNEAHVPLRQPAAIDQDRDIEVESFDAFAKLPDLLLAVPACVIWIRFELVDRPVDDLPAFLFRGRGGRELLVLLHTGSL